MTKFLRLLSESEKESSLLQVCRSERHGNVDERVYDVSEKSFETIPGKPFSYWVSENVREAFSRLNRFESDGREAQVGASTKDDFRFLRLSWEPLSKSCKWVGFAKGGVYSKYYCDIQLMINWKEDGREIEALVLQRYPYLNGNAEWVMHRESRYFAPGLTWPTRTTSGLGLRILPRGCVFSVKGSAAFVEGDAPDAILSLLAITASRPFSVLVELQLAAADTAARSYEVGIIQKTPVPDIELTHQRILAELALSGWSCKRKLDTVAESSHAFLLPAAIRERLGDFDPSAIHGELVNIQSQIDDITFELYGFSEEDRKAAAEVVGEAEEADDPFSEDTKGSPPFDALLSWAAGVAFGRFDWRLATGEREAPPEPEPFDPLPAKSPGMLPDGAEPYHRHAGILVDDPGHEHDLPRLMADVLETVDAQVDEDLRRWLRRDFFKYHLQQYSKSRRKAPIYWPLATASGSYTLWLYYPDLTDQTLFTAVNDFVEPKVKQVETELGHLRLAGASRSRADEKRLEELSDFRDELADLRDTLLKIAPDYKPNHDDGVQITAAPLWPLFRHKPWQKVLKETWEKLEQGDYDWAHLAMAYWPDRVREKCVTDKSLAIAHDLEHLYVEPEPAPKKTRGRKKSTGSSE